MRLWVDDLRNPPGEDFWIWATNSSDAIWFLNEAKDYGHQVEVVSLDHDLGGDDTSRRIVIWMIENDFWPVEVYVHSANPVGVEWLEAMIERYKP